MAHVAIAKFFDMGFGRYDQAQVHQGNWKERTDHEIGLTGELNVVHLNFRGGVQGEERIDGRDDQHEQQDHDQAVKDFESDREPRMPANVRVCGSNETLGEDQVDSKEKNDTGGDEDLSGNADLLYIN